ncbi:MAG: glycogen synthase GlgA [Deltaproteobacteria bacterium]|nr:glycogen synthase GlgA [Deltaproteobacteria bacterium]
MNILFAVSEAAPFAKTGGLADVAGALPLALAARGHQVYLFLPLYREIMARQKKLTETAAVTVPLGPEELAGGIVKLASEHPNLTIFTIRRDDFFDRPFLYGPTDKEYPDNGIRFTFFCRAVLETVATLALKIDIFHAHDWQTALIPVYLKTLYQDRPQFQGGSLFTIHNLGYQGIQDKELLPLTGLGWQEFTFERLEFFDRLNLLKGGIVYADALNTVSQAYSREILQAEFGFGLETVLQQRRDNLFGILNGVDYREWDPATDPFIDNHFRPGHMAGKKICKKKLGEIFQLPPEPQLPLIGMVSRLVTQKGFDLILPLLEQVSEIEAQFVFLGTGEPEIEEALQKLALAHPARIAFKRGYDNRLAHLIEAGADIFLMPSHYEPCGLNQMYSLRYGTVPLVRAVGGLDDSITAFNPETGHGNGFKFNDYTLAALTLTLKEALQLYRKPRLWHRLRQNGMRDDFSWIHSAAQYEALYTQIMASA